MSYLFALTAFLGGLLLQRILRDPGVLAGRLNTFVIWVAMPAMIFRAVPGLAFDRAALVPILVAWILFASAFVLVSLWAKYKNWSDELRVAAIILVGLGNTAFLGVPLTELLLGPESVAYAVIYDQLGSFLMLSTAAIVLISLHQAQRDDNKRDDKKDAAQNRQATLERSRTLNESKTLHRSSLALDILKRVFCFPPFVCLLISSLLPVRPFVEMLSAPLALIASLILPIALLVVGLHFRARVEKQDVLALTTVGLLKLILLPALVMFFVLTQSVKDYALGAVLLQSAMPPMVTPALLLISAGIATRQVATMLGYLTLIGCVTVYAWGQCYLLLM